MKTKGKENYRQLCQFRDNKAIYTLMSLLFIGPFLSETFCVHDLKGATCKPLLGI